MSLQVQFSDTGTYEVHENAEITLHPVPVIIPCKPRKRQRKKPKISDRKYSLKEILTEMTSVEKETSKKLKELEILTKQLAKSKAAEKPVVRHKNTEKVEVDKQECLITQELLQGTYLQDLIFRDIEPVKTIYKNQKFFDQSM